LKLVFLLLFLTSLTFAQTGASVVRAAVGRRALIIANSAYQHLPPIDSPKPNADALGAALTKAGFKIQIEYNQAQTNLVAAIHKFSGEIQPGDFVVVYFSGYGLQDPDDNADYLLPISFDPKQNSSTGRNAVSIPFLQSQLARAGSRMLIFDACRSGPDLSEGFGIWDPPPNTLVTFAAAVNHTATDPPGGGVNLFTAAVINAIEEPGSTPTSVLERSQAEVKSASGGKQVPYCFLTPLDQFYFTNPITSAVPTGPKPGESRENVKERKFYAWVPPATFKMGCVPNNKCEKDETPQHPVKVAGFWMGRTEVTNGSYDKFVAATVTTGKAPKPRARTDLPATDVSWNDASAYCKWAGGRLPTEAEWEHAARGGKQDQIYPWGNQITAAMAVYGRKAPLPTGSIDSPNGFGLFDMAGNVREWTSDLYDPAAYSSSAPPTGKERVVRGGAYNSLEKDLRVSARDKADPAKPDKFTGFRCVLPTLENN
jgi:formylglycine-generating enzyme required for sulfatase activity